MRAALLTAIGQPLEVVDVETPRPGPDEVLVRTHTCGVCRTDLHLQAGLAYVPKLPHIPGHEPGGTVVDVGREVRDITVGQRVVPHLFVRDRECRYTRSGYDAQATHLRGILGVTMPGAFAEFFVAPSHNLMPLPDEVDFAAGGLASCAAVTAVHAFQKSGVGLGDSAAVIGCGGIGLMVVQLLTAAGVQTTGFDLSSQAIEMARGFGADGSVLPPDALEANELDKLERAGAFDAVFEFVGRSTTMRLAATLARRRGRIIVVGEEDESPAISTIQIAQRELELIGARNGGMREMAAALHLMAQGTLRPPIAGRYPLGRIGDALDSLCRGTAPGRIVVDVVGTMN